MRGKVFFLSLVLFFLLGCLNEKKQTEMILRHYIAKNEGLIRDFCMESAHATWNLSLSGTEKDYQRLIDIELDFNKSNHNNAAHFSPDKFSTFTKNVFANEQDFQLLKKLKDSEVITDTLLNRQLTVLYQSFMGSQVDAERYKQIKSHEAMLAQRFLGVSMLVGKQKYGILQIDSIRKNTTDEVMLKNIFYTFRNVAEKSAPDIVQMVKVRNEFARDFGYRDFYQLALETKDQTPERIKSLLEEIERLTHDQYFDAKRMIDQILARKFSIPVNRLQVWHYHDERTTYLPKAFSDRINALFWKKDPIRIASDFFDGIGLPVDDVIEQSDLQYKPCKSAATFLLNIDFKNDLRMFSTIRDNLDGMKNIMHLCGHASHFKFISDSIPYLLKDPNTVITEGIAGFFESMATNYDWLKAAFNIDSTKNQNLSLICRHFYQVDRLLKCRKYLVVARFEMEIYRNPDQDLEALWYKLNQEYLGISPPPEKSKADWAMSKYMQGLSCTIHNYVLADLFSAQLQNTIEQKFFRNRQTVYNDNREIGQFLVSQLYRYGDEITWERLIERVTGEPLNPKYFVDYLINENLGQSKIQSAR